MWCEVLAENALKLRIWERGAGETLGCGTGACAAAVAAVLQGTARRGDPISVMSKGGILKIMWQETGNVTMTGNAEWVYTGKTLG